MTLGVVENNLKAVVGDCNSLPIAKNHALTSKENVWTTKEKVWTIRAFHSQFSQNKGSSWEIMSKRAQTMWQSFWRQIFRDAFSGPSQIRYAIRQEISARIWFRSFLFIAHRNRSDFCDLRLRCPSRTPEIARFPRQEKAMLHCDLRVRWKVASDLRFRAAILEPKTPSCCRISSDLAPSTRKSLAIAIVRFWCAKVLLYVISCNTLPC